MAGAPPSAPTPSKETAGESKEAAGKVVSADPATKTLVVKSERGEMTFEVKDKAANDLKNIKAGDNVRVQYTEVAGKLSAEAIQKG